MVTGQCGVIGQRAPLVVELEWPADTGTVLTPNQYLVDNIASANQANSTFVSSMRVQVGKKHYLAFRQLNIYIHPQRTICGKAHIWHNIGVKFNFIVNIIILT